MAQIIDRRLSGKNKSAVNRQRFLHRYKSQIKRAVADAVSGRSISDIENGEKISIPTKDITEPVFRHGKGGRREMVHPGNADFVTGDKIDRPPEGEGQGSRASDSGEGMDDFVFELSREEFMQFFFEDLELPNLVKTQLATLPEHKLVRAGFRSDGNPANLHVIRSMRSALGRRLALAGPHAQRLREVEASLAALHDADTEDEGKVAALEEEMARLKARIAAIPFLDTIDLRYSNRVEQPRPTSQAVMFCLMDVSGSMDEAKKNIAKRFFILLYLFLTRTYERLDLVFIRHHTVAREVDENDFFTSRESGGTVVSSALSMMLDIIRERYPSGSWNIYGAQASDGDNWDADSPICRDLLIGSLVPLVQYFAYIEITPDAPQNLWREYLKVKDAWPQQFAMQRIAGLPDIYPVFRELFRKQAA
ncbi:MAG: YeaH/YhbH family protein [Betaproteobacteria bacterium]|nr:YeaH/YhbH family protein [Betaproteobacteria bacterium]